MVVGCGVIVGLNSMIGRSLPKTFLFIGGKTKGLLIGFSYAMGLILKFERQL
jgi:hypothetical protein